MKAYQLMPLLTPVRSCWTMYLYLSDVFRAQQASVKMEKVKMCVCIVLCCVMCCFSCDV
jgi:hypothetical protein